MAWGPGWLLGEVSAALTWTQSCLMSGLEPDRGIFVLFIWEISGKKPNKPSLRMSEISKTSSSLSFRAYDARTTCLVSAPSPHADGFHLSPLQGHPLPLHCLRAPFHRAEARVGEQRVENPPCGCKTPFVSLLNPGGWLLPTAWGCPWAWSLT